jgi:hypothetical protein
MVVKSLARHMGFPDDVADRDALKFLFLQQTGQRPKQRLSGFYYSRVLHAAASGLVTTSQRIMCINEDFEIDKENRM